MTPLGGLLDGVVVMPVVTIHDPAKAVPLARALMAGGINAIEVTLRTEAGLPAIRAIADALPGALVGAGSVLDRGGIAAALSAGARFLVSPGTPAELLAAFREAPVPCLPGAATATEIVTLRAAGFMVQKLFPASSVGGPAFLKAIGGPLPDVRFCPTGGIGAHNAADYLALRNVACVGGSWVVPDDAVQAGDWDRISALARAAIALRP